MSPRIHKLVFPPRRWVFVLIAVALWGSCAWYFLVRSPRIPFDDIRWQAGLPHVQLEGSWYELVALEEINSSILVERAVQRWGPAYQDRFAFGLAELLKFEGKSPTIYSRLTLRNGPSVQTRHYFNSRSRWKLYRMAKADHWRVDRPRNKKPPDAFSFITLRIDGYASKDSRNWLSSTSAQIDLERLEWYLLHRYAYLSRKPIAYQDALDRIAVDLRKGISRRDFALQIARVLALFDDIHTGVLLPESRISLPSSTVPCEFLGVEGRVAGLRPGETGFLDAEYPFVRSLDGVPVAQLLEPLGTLFSKAFRYRALRHLRKIQFAMRLVGQTHDQTTLLELESRDGTRTTTRRLENGLNRSGNTTLPHVTWQTLPGQLGYLGLRNGMPSNSQFEKKIRAAFRQLRHTQGLIIDLRGNGGGSRAAIPALLRHILPPNTGPTIFNVAAVRMNRDLRPPPSLELLRKRWLYSHQSDRWSQAERNYIAIFRKDFKPEMALQDSFFSDWHLMLLGGVTAEKDFHYSGRVVVLHDETTASAADILLSALKGRPGIRLLGRTSAGGSGYPIRYPLPKSNVIVQISSMASFQTNGRLFEGTKPDIPYPLTLTDIERRMKEGVDPMLLAASKLLLAHRSRDRRPR